MYAYEKWAQQRMLLYVCFVMSIHCEWTHQSVCPEIIQYWLIVDHWVNQQVIIFTILAPLKCVQVGESVRRELFKNAWWKYIFKWRSDALLNPLPLYLFTPKFKIETLITLNAKLCQYFKDRSIHTDTDKRVLCFDYVLLVQFFLDEIQIPIFWRQQ